MLTNVRDVDVPLMLMKINNTDEAAIKSKGIIVKSLLNIVGENIQRKIQGPIYLTI